MGNVSFCSIARLLGVSDVAVLNWVRDEARKLPEPSTKADVLVVTLDEMWHFVKKKTAKLWIWRAYDPLARRTIAWVLGGRDDATCQKLLDKIGVEGKTFVTDDWEGYHRLIREDQLFTGKDLTVSIEQDNSNIRHFVARFRRRTKVVSKVVEMVDLSLSNYPPSIASNAGIAAWRVQARVAQITWKGFAPLRRAVSIVVRTSASACAADMAR